MEFLGSKGEWKIREWNNYDIITERNGLIISAYTGGCDIVEEISEEMAQANAKLAAAAPKMLEMLIEVSRHHQGGHSEIGHKIKQLIKEATEL